MKLLVGCLFAFLAFMVIGTMVIGLAPAEGSVDPNAPVMQSTL